MTFKQYRQTAQLFDKNNADLYQSTTLSIVNKWSYTSGTPTVIRIPCVSNTSYSLTINATGSVFRISTVSTESIPTEGSDVLATTIINSNEIQTYSFTTGANDIYILFQGNSNMLEAILNSLMLNYGSTPLPYELYGKKWYDISNYKRSVLVWNTDTAYERESGAWT